MDETAVQAFFNLPVGDDRATAWRTLRELGPVVDLGQFYVLAGRDAVDFALHRPDIFASAPAFTGTMGWPITPIPIGVDPPDHARYRRILDPLLSPKAIAALAPALRRQVGELVDGFAAGDGVDVIQELAVPFPSQAFLTLLGLPLEDRDQLIAWKTALINASGEAAGFGAADGTDTGSIPPDAGEVNKPIHQQLLDYLTHHLDERKSHESGGQDLLSTVLSIEGEKALSDDEILGMCYLFVLAGLDTVTAEIGFLFKYLAEGSALRRSIVADPSLIPGLVEEVLRLEPPAPFLPRVTTQAVEVGGCPVPAGAVVAVNVSSANREPVSDGEQFDAIDVIDTRRKGARHLGFGGGVHRCLGSHLARLELRIVLEEFHTRIPDYEIEPGFHPTVPWPAGSISLEKLQLRFRR